MMLLASMNFVSLLAVEDGDIFVAHGANRGNDSMAFLAVENRGIRFMAPFSMALL